MFNYTFLKTRIHILLALLPSLTVPKILNILRNYIAYILKLNIAGKVPPVITLHLSYKCNYTCIMCQKSSLDENSYTSGLLDMDFERLEKLLRLNAKYIAILRITGGEPMLYPDFERLVDLLNELKLKYTLLTNGSLLKKEIIPKLVPNCLLISISIDTADAKVYSFMRPGGDLEAIRGNIDEVNRLKKSKKAPFLNLACTCFNFNIESLAGLIEFCHQHKIPSISVSEGGYYNTPGIGEDNFIRNYPEVVQKSVNEAQDKADQYGILIRWNSPVLYFSLKENQLISNRNRITGCANFYLSGLITPDFNFRLCPLSDVVTRIDDDLKLVWNGDEMIHYRKEMLNNKFPATCRYCNDYNEHYNDSGKEYSFIDYQKRTHYWKKSKQK